MLGGLIGGGLSAIGSIAGGIASSKAMREARRKVEQMQKENKAWYDRRYNEDFTQRVEAQRVLNQTQDYLKNRNKQLAGSQAVTGGTDEAMAQQKAVNAQIMGDTAAKIATAGEARKDSIESQYRAKDDELNDKLINLKIGQAQNIANAMKGVASAGASIGSAFDPIDTLKGGK